MAHLPLTKETPDEALERRRRRFVIASNGRKITHGTVCRVARGWASAETRAHLSRYCVVDHFSNSKSTAYVNFLWSNFDHEGFREPSSSYCVPANQVLPLSPLELLALEAPDEVSQG
jgi:hypothetical protein